MENIQEEEEARLLASPNRRVAQAYSVNDQQKRCRKYAYWLVAFFAFVIVSSNSNSEVGDKKHKRQKKLRNKAEIMPEAEVHKLQQINNKIDLNEKYAQLNDAHAMYEDSEDSVLNNSAMQGEDDLNREVDRVLDGVEMVEQDEINSNNSMLTSAVKTMEDTVKFYLGRVIGSGENEDDDEDDDFMTESSADVKLTDEQLDQIAQKISERLEMDVKAEFRQKADSVKEEKVMEIEKVVAEDREARMDARDIEHDVKEAESLVVEDLKDEIDDAAERVKDEIPERVKRIRNDVVEEVTGKRLDFIEQRKRERRQKKLEMMERFNKYQEKKKLIEARAIHQMDKERTKLEGEKRMKRNHDSSGIHGSGGKKDTKRMKNKGEYSKHDSEDAEATVSGDASEPSVDEDSGSGDEESGEFANVLPAAPDRIRKKEIARLKQRQENVPKIKSADSEDEPEDSAPSAGESNDSGSDGGDESEEAESFDVERESASDDYDTDEEEEEEEGSFSADAAEE